MSSKLSAYIQLMRAPNGVTAISNILAASVIFSAGQLNFSVVLLCLASLCIYYAGMVFNDCFDFKEDSKDRPERPIPSGQIPLNTAWLLGGGFMAAGLGLAAIVGPVTLYAAVALCILVLAYDGLIKEGLPGAIAMGSCRYANWILGASFVATSVYQTSAWVMALPIGFYIAGLTYLSKQEVEAKNRSALGITTILLIASLISILTIIWQLLDLSIVFKGILSVATLAAAYPLACRILAVQRDFTPQTIQRMIGWMIIAIIPLDAFIVALNGSYFWAIIILLLLPLCRWLSRYAYMT